MAHKQQSPLKWNPFRRKKRRKLTREQQEAKWREEDALQKRIDEMSYEEYADYQRDEYQKKRDRYEGPARQMMGVQDPYSEDWKHQTYEDLIAQGKGQWGINKWQQDKRKVEREMQGEGIRRNTPEWEEEFEKRRMKTRGDIWSEKRDKYRTEEKARREKLDAMLAAQEAGTTATAAAPEEIDTGAPEGSYMDRVRKDRMKDDPTAQAQPGMSKLQNLFPQQQQQPTDTGQQAQQQYGGLSAKLQGLQGGGGGYNPYGGGYGYGPPPRRRRRRRPRPRRNPSV